MEKSFFMLKGEAYWLEKADYIVQRVQDSDLEIFAHWQVRITARDVLQMYPGWLPRGTILARLPFLYDCDVLWVKGKDAIQRMNETKHAIRDEIWGRHVEKGGFLHAPDDKLELQQHAGVLRERIVPFQRKVNRLRLSRYLLGRYQTASSRYGVFCPNGRWGEITTMVPMSPAYKHYSTIVNSKPHKSVFMSLTFLTR